MLIILRRIRNNGFCEAAGDNVSYISKVAVAETLMPGFEAFAMVFDLERLRIICIVRWRLCCNMIYGVGATPVQFAAGLFLDAARETQRSLSPFNGWVMLLQP